MTRHHKTSTYFRLMKTVLNDVFAAHIIVYSFQQCIEQQLQPLVEPSELLNLSLNLV